jgi:class 3 adenylate cyclase
LDSASFPAGTATRRVERSFAFVDLCGFTDFAETGGDEAAVNELKGLRAAIREVAPLCGVRVDKWLGDGAMLVGVDIETVVAATVALRHRLQGQGRLAMRAGIASGPVLSLEGDDYVGRAVNLAARLCDVAEPDQVLACVEGLRAPAWVHAVTQPPLKLKGLAQPVEVTALEAEESHGDTDTIGVLTGPARSLRTLVEGITRPVRPRRPVDGPSQP